jgi:DNA-binding transcriptional MerR regulator
LTIGAVCKALMQEFPDISISKIRYLENQKLISPRRTSGGYRIYTSEDIAQLRAVLRLQRDEFLPLRVIRQELAAGNSPAQMSSRRYNNGNAVATHRTTVQDRGVRHAIDDVITETHAPRKLIEELEEFGIISGENRAGVRYYDDAEREIIVAATELSRYGVAGRNLRIFRTSVEREGALLQQILAPALRSRNPERRKEAVEALENLASVATHMKHLLLIRDLRKLT